MKSTPIRILLVDDDEDDYLIISSLLNEALNPKPLIEWTARSDEAREAIASRNHDVYLVDYRLGEVDGLELIRSFEVMQWQQPFIILTGAGDELVERQAMQLGAADYLVKGTFSAELLRRVVEYSLQRKRIEAQRIEHLVELNRSKDEFIALTSHQLRTPATAVKQYLGILLGGYAGDMDKEHEALLKRAYASNDRQLKVVNDILRVAQLDLQKVELKPEKVDVAHVLDQCLQEIRLVAEGRQQQITFTKPKEDVYVACDAAFTAMAIGNILDNASKYSDAHTIIRISMHREGEELALVIADQGVGIDPADQDKLFEKFSRINNPLSVKAGGTGLGLYWAKTIMNMQHGDISVKSEPGKGSTFTITLPRL